MAKNNTATGLLCLAFVALSGCKTAPSFAEHDKKYEDLSVKELLSDDSLTADDRQMLGDSFIKRAASDASKGDHESAERNARRAFEMNPKDMEATLALANALFGSRKFQDAEPIYAALAAETPSAEVHQGYGLAMLAQNRGDEARPWLLKAVKENPKLWRAWNGLGVIYDMSEAWELAELAFQAAIAANGHNPTLSNNLGLSYMRQERYPKAVTAFKNAVELANDPTATNMNYRTALALNGQIDQATAGATDTQVAQLYNNLGVNAIDKGDPETAIKYLKRAIATSPSYYANAVENLEIAKSALP